MTTKTNYRVLCECGHEGRLIQIKTHHPFSTTWETYSLNDLDGTPFTTNVPFSFKEVFSKTKASCPNCKKQLSVDDLKLDGDS